jgi:hypothetical protein
MNTKYILGPGLLCAFALLSACSTTPVCIAPSTTPLEKKSVTEYDRVEGSNSAYSILGLWMIGRPDIDAAIADALTGTEGTALTDECALLRRLLLLSAFQRQDGARVRQSCAG